MLFKLLVLTSNNVVLVNFSAILFNEIRHVAETSTVSYVSVCYEPINLFIEPQNFLLIFFICKLKGLYLIVMICDSLLMFSLDLFNSCIKPTWYNIFQYVLLKCFTLVFLRFFNDMDKPKDLSRPPTDVSICLRPKNFPTLARLNQFCSLLSTSTSMSLRLNSLDLLLPLETFNTEVIFIIISGPGEVIFDLWVGAGRYFYVNIGLAFCTLHFTQNYPSSVSNHGVEH